jgi:hypothetical protein
MRRNTLLVAVLLLSLAAVPGRADAQGLPADSMEVGRRYTDWFLQFETDSLWAHMTPEFREDAGDASWAEELAARVTEAAGLRLEIIDEEYVTRGGARQYWQTGRYSNMDQPFMIRWVIEPDGSAAGLGLNPASQAPPVDPR